MSKLRSPCTARLTVSKSRLVSRHDTSPILSASARIRGQCRGGLMRNGKRSSTIIVDGGDYDAYGYSGHARMQKKNEASVRGRRLISHHRGRRGRRGCHPSCSLQASAAFNSLPPGGSMMLCGYSGLTGMTSSRKIATPALPRRSPYLVL
jgi:hypothetical protein